MEQFLNDISAIVKSIDNNKANNNTKHIIKTSILSKQYLAYYLYRITTKFMNIVSLAIPIKQIKELLAYLRIPTEHDYTKNYPLAGKMTNDEKILDIIILIILSIFNDVEQYIKVNHNTNGNTTVKSNIYSDLYTFIKNKNLNIILKDLQDLYTLVPGLTVKSGRFNYINNNIK